ncbi:bifunctional endoribonuclease/protein kinase ire1 [Neofusicoccum ribis]|uniref:non-specific serine/threonine protein kinase n=1 Tax=Neofusicoccum ribis TaxID=45134 RepID=A0ABR3SQK5_9PEZI
MPHRNVPFISKNERAIATLAPAASEFAVRAPPARSAAGPSGGISSRPRARSLQDWEVEDFVLLATVDGKIYARDRNTGEERWTLFADRPMVDMVYHQRNKSEDGDGLDDGPEWIVEPNQDGDLYVATRAPNIGIHKLNLTVRQLAEELSPYASDDPPVVYTAEKRNTLYTVDAATGRILKQFSSSGSSVIDEGSCRRISGFEGIDEDECESIGTLALGRTEYTVGIANRDTGTPICTIRYFEWAPNNRDRDLQDQYSSTMDNKYVYSKHDGYVYALDHTKERERHVYRGKFDSPVVRVYDIVRPFHANSRDTSLVLLPQPPGPATIQEYQHDVFVNCTENGAWYAMSETSYPAVTDGASPALCYTFNWNEAPGVHRQGQQSSLKPLIVGVHSLSATPHSMPLIGGAEDVLPIDAPREPEPVETEIPPPKPSIAQAPVWPLSIWTFVVATLFLILGASLSGDWKKTLHKPLQNFKFNAPHPPPVSPSVPQIEVPESPTDQPAEQHAEERKVRFQMGGEEITVPGENAPTVDGTEGMVQPGEAPGRTDSPQPGDEGENGQETPKKKKAHRGQRGGRKRNKNRRNTNAESEGEETEKVVANVKKFGEDQNVSADEEAVSGQGVSEFSSAKQIHNLTITDKVLGSGSGGTFVFEGKFEGRDVAVKRMLPQYYELADQEVSLLTQSDDHPNVIRYFCKQKDENFLYIAVELCQASLWDLYKDGRNDDPWTDQQVGLVNEINTDVPRALYQLAAGLHHLHSLRIIHRDIKPQNILIAYPKKNQTGGPRFVISDFGLCKTLPDNVSTLVGTTNNAGTIGWKAPELILKPKESEGRMSSSQRDSSTSNDPVSQGVKRSVDIFSLGCVFFYVLTNGSHPFDDEEGWMQIRELNIKKNKFNFSKLEYLGDDSEEPIHLISRMLSNNPVDRPTAMQVMQHPFFWSPEKRLTFLCQVSDRFEFEPRDPPSTSLCRLEARNIEVMCPAPKGQHTNHTFSKFPDFLSKLDRKFIDTLGKQRKYNGDKMLDLLRALRNKKNHYYDMPSDVQAKVGPLPDGYLRYWTTRFPKLLMACYEVVVECGFDQEPGFRTYFEPATP